MWSEFVSNLSFEIRTIAICCLAKLKISYCHEYSGILLLYSLLYSKDQLYYLNSVKKLYQTLDLNEQDIDYDSLRRSYETLQRYYNVFKNVKTKLEKQISNGESKTLEFKETLSLDLKNQVKEKGIELSSLKTITGFLNSDGGDLLIGINDNEK